MAKTITPIEKIDVVYKRSMVATKLNHFYNCGYVDGG